MAIYALSSGPGTSGVAVIRVSGKETSDVIRLLTGKEPPEPRKACLRKVNKINTSEPIDEGIIIWFPGPQSYTGEDMAEFHVHGSKAVVEAIQSSISKIKDCRLAEPGEFTKLAFQNGKINLLKAESIADLISSETEIQRKQAIKIMNGKSSNTFNKLREKLLKILSHIEAKIDFPDENLPKDILNNIKKKCDDKNFAVTDLSHSRTVIELKGKSIKEILKKGCPINFNEFKLNNCANSVFHGITITIDMINDSPETFRIFALRSFGESLYHSVTDACLEEGYKGI